MKNRYEKSIDDIIEQIDMLDMSTSRSKLASKRKRRELIEHSKDSILFRFYTSLPTNSSKSDIEYFTMEYKNYLTSNVDQIFKEFYSIVYKEDIITLMSIEDDKLFVKIFLQFLEDLYEILSNNNSMNMKAVRDWNDIAQKILEMIKVKDKKCLNILSNHVDLNTFSKQIKRRQNN